MENAENKTDEADALVERMRARIPPARDHDQIVQQNQSNGLEAFMASTERMTEMQRRKIMEAESNYQVERIKLLDSYRVRMENLKYEAAAAVRKLDERHYEESSVAKKLLDRLASLRNMPLGG